MKLVFSLCLLGVALAGSNEKSKKWLEENKKKDGVITLASGLQYKVLRKGDGQHHPTADSSCECHYEGTLIDGTVFDSSYKRGSPTSFAPNQVIKGWTEAMQMMVEGDKWEMYIPSELGYGDSGSGAKIGGGDALIFQMEILKIKGSKVPANRCDPLKVKAGGDDHGCDEKEEKYVHKMKESEKGALEKEIKRLNAMKGKKMKPSLLSWVGIRLNILSKLRDEL